MKNILRINYKQTHNTKDYKNIDGLIVIDPYEK
jgi:hypothetical protein